MFAQAEAEAHEASGRDVDSKIRIRESNKPDDHIVNQLRQLGYTNIQRDLAD